MNSPPYNRGPAQPARPPQVTVKRMTMDAITFGPKAEPWAMLIYGSEGVGKSSLAVDIQDSITLDIEQSANRLATRRFPVPTMLSEVYDAIELLYTNQHPFKTLVIDTIDRLEALIHAEVVKQMGKKQGYAGATSIEDAGFGKGHQFALDEWRRLIARLDELRTYKRMNILLLGHTLIRPFRNPDGPDYDRYVLKVNEKAGGFLKEWCDAVLFARFHESTTKLENRIKGIMDGRRTLHTARTAAFDAKNRFDLPDELPLDWKGLEKLINAAAAGTGKEVAR